MKQCLLVIATLSGLWTLSISAAPRDSCTVVWERIQQISHDTTNSVVPQVVAVGDTVHLLWFGNPAAEPVTYGNGIQYARSTNGGRTFSEQHQLATFDSARGAYGVLAAAGRYVYVARKALVDSPAYDNLAVMRSTDAGLTWEPRRLLGNYIFKTIAARDSHIVIYSPYFEPGAFLVKRFWVSHDYGVTWDSVRADRSRMGVFSAQLIASPRGFHLIRGHQFPNYEEVFYSRSTDWGRTWSRDDTLSTNEGYNSQVPRLACDGGSNVYAVWNDQKYGGGFSGTILLRKSTDNGATWQAEQIISQLETAVFCDVAAEGNRVVVVWDTEVTNYTGLREGKLSVDGGVSWCPQFAISTMNRRTGVPVVSFCNRRIHVIWEYEEPPGTPLEIVYTRSAQFPTSVDQELLTAVRIVLRQNYPNPFNPSTTIEFSTPQPTRITLKIVDMLGREVRVLLDEQKAQGKYRVRFDGSGIASGVYYAVLTSPSFSPQVRKLILLR